MIPAFDDFFSLCKESTNDLASTLCNASIKTSFKEDGSIVTNFDIEIEKKIRDVIKHSFPHHSIIGEELVPHQENESVSWIIDPIDGTLSFSHGSPLFGTLIGLLENGEPRYGFMRLPMVNDTILYSDGNHTYVNEKPSNLKTFNGWNNSLVLTTDVNTILTSPASSFWNLAIENGAIARTWGDCFGYFMFCSGRADMMTDTNLKKVDILPIIPLLKGVGASIVTFGMNDYQHLMALSPEGYGELKNLSGKS